MTSACHRSVTGSYWPAYRAIQKVIRWQLPQMACPCSTLVELWIVAYDKLDQKSRQWLPLSPVFLAPEREWQPEMEVPKPNSWPCRLPVAGRMLSLADPYR